MYMLIRYLANFARTGDPNGASSSDGQLPPWEQHASGAERFMELGPALGMRESGDDPATERARFTLLREYLLRGTESESAG